MPTRATTHASLALDRRVLGTRGRRHGSARVACRRTSRRSRASVRLVRPSTSSPWTPAALRSPTCSRRRSKSVSPIVSGRCERFDRVSAAPAPTAAAAPARVPPPYGTNDNVAAGRRFVLVIDQESFAAGREQLFRDAIEGLLAQLTPADRAMVAALPFGGVMVPFTSDKARIRLAAGRVAGQGSRTETGSGLACRTRRFLESLDGLLRERGALDSPQTLVLFTAGLAGPAARRTDGRRAGYVRAARRSVPPGREHGQRRARERLHPAAGRHRDERVAAATDDSAAPATSGPTTRSKASSTSRVSPAAPACRSTRPGPASLLRVARESSAYYVAELEPAARRSLRPQPSPERARRTARRHRPCTPGHRPHRHGARQDDAPDRQRRPRLDRGVRPISGCASAASPYAIRTASCASASWWNRWTRPSRSRRLAPS